MLTMNKRKWICSQVMQWATYGMVLFLFSGLCYSQDEHRTLEIGRKSPDFQLPGVDGKTYRLSDFTGYRLLVIIFTCNHCPTAQSYEDRIISLVNDYRNRGVGFVAIEPNDPLAIRLNELAYTDLSDDLESMKIRAAAKGFNFPYLYDGENQKASLAYGPAATPHVFIFDGNRELQYIGRIDDSEEGVTDRTNHDTRNALDELLSGKPVTVKTTKTFGCSIKWADKREAVKKDNDELAKEPVNVALISLDQLDSLIKNQSTKLRLINIWATWCGPCVAEFHEFVTISKIYRGRGLEFVSISLDSPKKMEEVLSFLKDHHASNANYLYNSMNKYPFIEVVDKNWQGAVPYTILVKPGGEIVYSKQGEIDPLAMKRQIVDILGRAKDW
jgi:thiol-disulfide isomerase/thioredoxin